MKRKEIYFVNTNKFLLNDIFPAMHIKKNELNRVF